MKKRVYMKKKKLELFIDMADTAATLNQYELEDEDDGKLDEEFYERRGEYRDYAIAYAEVRRLLDMEDEYERFRIIVLDSQLQYIRDSGQYDSETIKKYAIDYNINDYESSQFRESWAIEDDIFDKGWHFNLLYKKCVDPEADLEFAICKKLFKSLKHDQRNKKKRMKCYLTLDEAKKYIKKPDHYECTKCGTLYYGDVRSAFEDLPSCPMCGSSKVEYAIRIKI